MIGLKRGRVELLPHQEAWTENAQSTIERLKGLLGKTAVDIQHVGSTAILSIHAKPIIDIAIGVRRLEDIMPYEEVLRENGFIFRGEDVSGQILFVRGDFENDIRTHHIHVVEWNGKRWKDYINFRDYLNAFPEKAAQYDACKQKLAAQFFDHRESYTAGKEEVIDGLLEEAGRWKAMSGLNGNRGEDHD